mmetsp:Transcript_15468/g.29803  ORF Transcript_15468/g.29803 Transcript_15468/m.29803 type:complete len:211 (+) Transcript_15468:1882-2514(+)
MNVRVKLPDARAQLLLQIFVFILEDSHCLLQLLAPFHNQLLLLHDLLLLLQHLPCRQLFVLHLFQKVVLLLLYDVAFDLGFLRGRLELCPLPPGHLLRFTDRLVEQSLSPRHLHDFLYRLLELRLGFCKPRLEPPHPCVQLLGFRPGNRRRFKRTLAVESLPHRVTTLLLLLITRERRALLIHPTWSQLKAHLVVFKLEKLFLQTAADRS